LLQPATQFIKKHLRFWLGLVAGFGLGGLIMTPLLVWMHYSQPITGPEQSSDLGALESVFGILDTSPTTSPQGDIERLVILGRVLESLPKGNVVLDAPTNMVVGDRRQVTATVGYNVPIIALIKTISTSRQQLFGSLRISSEMSARLIGAGFDIKSSTTDAQTIAQGFAAEWNWVITAEQEGDQQLEVTLYASVIDGSKSVPVRVESFVQKISVSVRATSWSERLDAVSHELKTLNTIWLTLGGFGTAALAWFGLHWRRRPNNHKRAPHKSPEHGNPDV
jgi:hypothetical protein